MEWNAAMGGMQQGRPGTMDAKWGRERQSLVERNEKLREEIKLRAKIDELARKNAEVRAAAADASADEEALKLVEKLKKAYETAEQEVARKLAEFSLVEHMFPKDEQDRIKAVIRSTLTEGIEEFDLQALRNDSKKAPDLVKHYDKIKAKTEEVNGAARDLGLTFASAFEDAIVAADSLRDVLKGLLDDIIRIFTRITVTEPLAAALTGWFSGGLFGGGAAAAGGGGGGYVVPSRMPGMASGGSVMGGMPVLVGERGPEVFTPAMSGQIIPNHGIGGVTVYTTVNVDSRADREQLRAELGQVVSASVEASVGRVRQLSRRGRLL